MKRVLSLILALAMVFALAACSGNNNAAETTTNDTASSTTETNTAEETPATSEGTEAASGEGRTVYKLGLPTMLTGFASMKGISGMQAAKIAAEEINAAGGINGIPVELVIEDTASDTSQAIEVARKFIADDSIVGIIGCDNTADSVASMPLYTDAKMPFVSIMASSNTFAPSSDYAWTVSGMVKNEVECTAAMIADHLQGKSVVMVYVNNDWGTSFLGNFQQCCDERGVELLATESYVDGETDFSSLMAKCRQYNPDVLFLGSQYAEAASICNTVADMGWDVKIAGTGAIVDNNFLDLAGENAEGVYAYAATVWTDEYPVAVEFANKYKELYNENPNVFCCAWEAVYAMCDALKTLPEEFTRDELNTAIGNLTIMKGLNGDMTWDEVGNTVKNYGYMRVVDGAWTVDGYYVAN